MVLHARRRRDDRVVPGELRGDHRQDDLAVAPPPGEARRERLREALRLVEEDVGERVRGLALMQLGRLEETREALVESETRARADSADYEVALALDALVTLGLLEGRPAEKTERERDRIFGRLGVVRTPRIPLPLSAR